nr:hypothetical protein [Burkholderia plantarii]
MKGILRSLVVVRDVVRVWCVATCFGYGLGYEAGQWRGWIVIAVRSRAYRLRCPASRPPPRPVDAAQAGAARHAATGAPSEPAVRTATQRGGPTLQVVCQSSRHSTTVFNYDTSPKKPRVHAEPIRTVRRAAVRDININPPPCPPLVAHASIARGGPGHSHPHIVEYHGATSLAGCDDKVAWCSSFVDWCPARAGFTGTGSAPARAWLAWGRPLDAPVYGLHRRADARRAGRPARPRRPLSAP